MLDPEYGQDVMQTKHYIYVIVILVYLNADFEGKQVSKKAFPLQKWPYSRFSRLIACYKVGFTRFKDPVEGLHGRFPPFFPFRSCLLRTIRGNTSKYFSGIIYLVTYNMLSSSWKLQNLEIRKQNFVSLTFCTSERGL